MQTGVTDNTLFTELQGKSYQHKNELAYWVPFISRKKFVPRNNSCWSVQHKSHSYIENIFSKHDQFLTTTKIFSSIKVFFRNYEVKRLYKIDQFHSIYLITVK